jgi:hypothetical protein
MDRRANQRLARTISPSAGSPRTSAPHLLRLLLPGLRLDHAKEAFLKHALRKREEAAFPSQSIFRLGCQSGAFSLSSFLIPCVQDHREPDSTTRITDRAPRVVRDGHNS